MAAQKLEGTARLFRFGQFEFDSRSGELRKHGRRIRLQSKPRLVLQRLLERAGEFITREELRSCLWSDGTVVDFTNGLNTALSRLRAVLGDSAANPRFVETVDRRGYRFVAPLEVISVGQPPESGESEPDSAIGAKPGGVGVAGKVREHPIYVPRAGFRRRSLAVTVIGAVLATGFVWVVWWGRLADVSPPGPTTIRSVAVLPLIELGSASNEQFFADGLTSALITELSSIESLRVPPYRAVAPYRGSMESPVVIARTLGTAAVVEGTIMRSPDTVRFAVRLIDGLTGRDMWTGTYARRPGDVVTLQGEIAATIAEKIVGSITPGERARLGRDRRVNPEAFESYAKATFLWNQRTEDGLRKSAEYYERAVRLDPGYAAAWAGIAGCYGPLAGQGYVSPHEARTKMRETAFKAIELDPDSAEAHMVVAGLYMNFEWDWSEAERLYRKALSLDPTYASAWQRLGALLMIVGRVDEAVTATRRARELDPTSLSIATSVALRLYLARKYEEALTELSEAERLDPSFLQVQLYQGQTLIALGRYSEADRAFERAERIAPTHLMTRASRAYLFAKLQQPARAQAVYRDLQQLRRARYVSPYDQALVATALGWRNRALDHLEAAFRERTPWMVYLGLDPMLDPLREDVRFTSLVTQMRLAVPR